MCFLSARSLHGQKRLPLPATSRECEMRSAGRSWDRCPAAWTAFLSGFQEKGRISCRPLFKKIAESGYVHTARKPLHFLGGEGLHLLNRVIYSLDNHLFHVAGR